MIGINANIVREGRPATDMDITHADIHKAKDLLGWTPVTNLEEGLQSAVDWYRANRTLAMDLELH
jgi:nucleoside-diphosphate-sugar epimerase